MYKAKVIKFPFNKTYRCKGHVVMKDCNCTMLVLENEHRVFIPDRLIIEFGRGWFEMEKERVKKETKGQVQV